MLGTEFLVDVDLIERVEIIRGPSSSLYGADAFFAVINVIIRKPPQLKGVELSFRTCQFWHLPRTGQLWRPVSRDRHAALRHVLQQSGTDPVFPPVRQSHHQFRHHPQYGLRKLATPVGHDQFPGIHPARIVQCAR